MKCVEKHSMLRGKFFIHPSRESSKFVLHVSTFKAWTPGRSHPVLRRKRLVEVLVNALVCFHTFLPEIMRSSGNQKCFVFSHQFVSAPIDYVPAKYIHSLKSFTGPPSSVVDSEGALDTVSASFSCFCLLADPVETFRLPGIPGKHSCELFYSALDLRLGPKMTVT